MGRLCPGKSCLKKKKKEGRKGRREGNKERGRGTPFHSPEGVERGESGKAKPGLMKPRCQ
jgi:hypothetical protein